MHRQRLAHDRSVPKEVDVRRTEPHSLRARARQEAECPRNAVFLRRWSRGTCR